MAQDRGVVVAGASRPYPGEPRNGDAWQVDWHASQCRIAVVDGLGHGPEAALASSEALRALAARPQLSPEEGLRVCHAALRATRGAAISIAAIDTEASRLTFAGVGNAEACLLLDGTWQRLIAYRGIVGATLPRLRTFTFQLTPGWSLAMFTDGVRSRFQFDALPLAADQEPQTFASESLENWARESDDATIVIARPA
jgi:serine phosphatase RsbU (regulator of sigma subunit)